MAILTMTILTMTILTALLLLDEAFAPLDPASKALVTRRLRSFCAASLVLVIYHGEDADADADDADDGTGALGDGDGAPLDVLPRADDLNKNDNNDGNLDKEKDQDLADDDDGSIAPVASPVAEACAVGDGFFDGVVGFSDDGNVTLLELCRHDNSNNNS